MTHGCSSRTVDGMNVAALSYRLDLNFADVRRPARRLVKADYDGTTTSPTSVWLTGLWAPISSTSCYVSLAVIIILLVLFTFWTDFLEHFISSLKSRSGFCTAVLPLSFWSPFSCVKPRVVGSLVWSLGPIHHGCWIRCGFPCTISLPRHVNHTTLTRSTSCESHNTNLVDVYNVNHTALTRLTSCESHSTNLVDVYPAKKWRICDVMNQSHLGQSWLTLIWRDTYVTLR